MTLPDDVASVFRGKKVLVTGHTGFKGSWLTVWLTLLGAEVTGYALAPATKPNHFDLLEIKNKITHVTGDIRDRAKLDAVFKASRPEIVFHLAAQALVRRSYNDPAETFDVNVLGGVNVLEMVRRHDCVEALVFVTSDKCYENKEWIWSYREIDRLGGRDPYSASKACAELTFSSYQRSFFDAGRVRAASARAGNVIGGGDWSDDRIVPDCVRALLSNQQLVLRNPHATRPWQHVLEPLSGYLTLASRLLGADGDRYVGAWNFGPSPHDARTVLDVANRIAAHFGRAPDIGSAAGASPHEATLLQLNWEKASGQMGWKPTWSFEKSVSETASWYKSWSENSNVWALSTSQVVDFSKAHSGPSGSNYD